MCIHPKRPLRFSFWAVPGRLWYVGRVGWKLIMYMLILHYAVIQLRYSRTQADPQDQEGRVHRELDHARAAAGGPSRASGSAAPRTRWSHSSFNPSPREDVPRVAFSLVEIVRKLSRFFSPQSM